MAGRVVHFEIPIDDGERATSFYARAFGWDFDRWGDADYWMTEAGQGEGIGGALTTRNAEMPSLMFYIDVEDIDASLRAIEAAGGTRLTDRMAIPTIGWSAFFRDTEGNTVGLFQADPSATTGDG